MTRRATRPNECDRVMDAMREYDEEAKKTAACSNSIVKKLILYEIDDFRDSINAAAGEISVMVKSECAVSCMSQRQKPPQRPGRNHPHCPMLHRRPHR